MKTQLLAILAGSMLLTSALPARAADPLAEGVTALRDGKADEAVARFEALANAGTVDAHASFDRGLAYAARLVREPKPGDFGQAIAAFEEAAALSDGALHARADHAADLVRGELAKKRHREGAKAAFEPAPSLLDRTVELLPELVWFGLGALLCVLSAIAARLPRERGSSRVLIGLAALLALPCLAAAFTMKSRQQRELRAVLVVESARLLDTETHRPLADYEPLVEGALLRVEPTDGSELRVRAAGVHGVLPRTSVRLLAR